ncbi:helix-turn-helix domain-containing protein [Frankia tisae]|uniref:helix-turn-helix domain-containing protein n=1 Tax=Frankia tisae TaxID=2950104 RepID=UPI0021C12815|nr:helix-turn-helix domain-containing protein [Frankia tisae]
MTTPAAPSPAQPTPTDLVARTEVPARWPAISERLARRLTTEGRIPSWRVGSRVYVSAGDVERWLASCRQPAA